LKVSTENTHFRFQSLERDLNSSLSEVQDLKGQNNRLKLEKNVLEQELLETQQTLLHTQTEFSKLQGYSGKDFEALVIQNGALDEVFQ